MVGVTEYLNNMHIDRNRVCDHRICFPVTHTAQPSLSLDPSTDQDIERGDSITITCTDTQGNPPPSFTWTRDDIMLESVGRVSITASEGSRYSELLITSLEPEDAGRYECIAVNPLNPAIGTAKSLLINVLCKPLTTLTVI